MTQRYLAADGVAAISSRLTVIVTDVFSVYKESQNNARRALSRTCADTRRDKSSASRDSNKRREKEEARAREEGFLSFFQGDR